MRVVYHSWGRPVKEYAGSLKGNNSLLERRAGKEDLKLIPRGMAMAEGGPEGESIFYGYRFKMLYSRIDSNGKLVSYKDGASRMIDGHALIGYPYKTGVTGRLIFLVSESDLYVRDMGSQTENYVRNIRSCTPDSDWKPIQ